MLRNVLLAFLAALAADNSRASIVSLAGTFTTDDQLELIPIVLGRRSLVDAQTLSYAAGGFDPTLSLFAGTGSKELLASNEDMAPGMLDAQVIAALDAGSYTLAVTESPNRAFGPTLADGFPFTGTGNFTGGPFLDIFGQQRTGAWALTVEMTPLNTTPTPEPAGTTLAGVVLLGCAYLLRKRRRALP